MRRNSPAAPRLPRAPIVTTWSLWRHLTATPSHPLFRYTLKHAGTRLRSSVLGCVVPPLLSMVACCGLSTVPLIWRSTIPPYFLAAIVLTTTLYVGFWVIDISALIARQREHNAYDLLCVAPSGPLGVHWALCTASLQYKNTLAWIDMVRILMAGGLLAIFVPSALDFSTFLSSLPVMILLAGGTILEHRQTTVLGCLIGMHAPLMSISSARVWAGLAFAVLQVGTLLASLVSFTVIHRILPTSNGSLILGLLAFFLLREGIVIVLWRSLARQFNTDPGQIDLALG